MSFYFRNWIFLPNDSRWALQWSSACGRTQTTGRLRAQLCKCCADFKGNHHVCGHGRSSEPGREIMSCHWNCFSALLLHQGLRNPVTAQSRSIFPWEDTGSSEGLLCMQWVWHECHNISIFISIQLGISGAGSAHNGTLRVRQQRQLCQGWRAAATGI